MFIEYEDHGGECCGMAHFIDVGPNVEDGDDADTYIDKDLKCIKKEILYLINSHKRKGLFEIVLTDKQIEAVVELEDMLADIGFKQVNRFFNPGSGNICNVYHWVRNY